MSVRGTESYRWFAYRAKRACALESARGQAVALIPGRCFGLRAAGSKPGWYRLVTQELGPSVVFTLSEDQVRGLLRASAALEAGAPPASARAQALAKRLARTDPGDFWAVVRALDWPRHHRHPDYADEARAALREAYGVRAPKRLWSAAARHRKRLQAAVARLERRAGRQLYLGGDDSFHDAAAHAVSAGCERYERYLADPETFIRAFNRNSLQSQNFENCFD